MNIRHLKLRFFRNHSRQDLDFNPGLNLLTGPNGSGKTNIIDAIHYLCMSRSFVASSDQYVVMQGESGFRVDGGFEGSIRSSFRVTCTWSRGEGKKIFVNDSPLDRLSDLIGMVPVVVLSPDDKRLTSEGPAERRSFLDAMISQISRSYLMDLIDYRRIVKQRNRLLSDPHLRPAELGAYLEPWNRQLVGTGSRIILKRHQVLEQFSAYLQETYNLISGIGHRPHFVYKTITDTLNSPAVENVSSGKSQETKQERAGRGHHPNDDVKPGAEGTKDTKSPEGTESPGNMDHKRSTEDTECKEGLEGKEAAGSSGRGHADQVKTAEAHVMDEYDRILADDAVREREREQTLSGPHRDDLIFYLDDQELRKFGSQGQHRLFALALKLAQLHFYSEHLDDQPVLLLDDVFGDLDPQKTAVLLDSLAGRNTQTFITAANPEPFSDLAESAGDVTWYAFEEGGLIRRDR